MAAVTWDAVTSSLDTVSYSEWNRMRDRIKSPYVVVAQDDSGDYKGSSNVTIQAAIDAVHALNGGSIFIKEGNYTINSSLTIYSDINLIGSGINNTILTAKNNLNTSIISIGAGINNIKLSDFSIDGNGDNQASYSDGINFNSANNQSNCIFQNLEVYDCRDNGITCKGNNNKLLNCHASGCNYQLGGADNILMYGNNNVISNCTSTAVRGNGSNNFGIWSSDNTTQSIIISNCVSSNSNNVGFNFEGFGHNIACIGCSSYGDTTAINISLSSGTPEGLIIDAFTAYDFNLGITGGVSYVTISNSYLYTSEAVDCITWSSTNNSEFVNIVNNTLRSAGRGITINSHVTKCKVTDNYIDVAGNALDISSPDSIISNNYIANGAYGLICPNLDSVTVTGNKFYNTTNRALNLYSTAYKNWIISNNYFEACTIGIWLTGLSDSVVSNNNVLNSIGAGITLRGTGGSNIVSNNISKDNGASTQTYGINIPDATQVSNLIIGNICLGNTTSNLTDSGTTTTLANNITS